MKPGRPALPHALLAGLVAATTTWAALTSWRGFMEEPWEFLVPLAVCGVIIATTGALLRRVDAPRLVILVVQVVVVSAYVSLRLVDSAVPSGATIDALGQALRSAGDSARTYQAPIGPDAPPITPLLVVGGAVFLLLVDLMACTLRRVPVAGLVLLAVYSVPAGLTSTGPGWMGFLGAATGFLVLLHLDTRDRLLRWGRPLGPSEASPWTDNNPLTDAVRAGAGRIGVAATAMALVVPVFVPVLDLELLGIGPGDGDDDVTIENPRADLRRDLERGEDIPLLQVTTDDPEPDYLRVAVLNRFTGEEWSSGDRAASEEYRATGPLPPPAGVASTVERTEYHYDVDIYDGFDSTWLPTQFPASSVSAEGDWRYDPDSMDFMAFNQGDEELDTSGLSYEMTALDFDYGTDGRFFAHYTPGAVTDEVLAVPGGLPSEVRNYAKIVTEEADDSYEAALLLQRWFRTEGEFRYSLDKAPVGTGGATFATFLNKGPEGRVGYCEQFASAMAIMARVLDIPARVAIGFLEPDPVGVSGDEYVYSSHDLHAWPELYFSGAGWVRFEPTPPGLQDTSPPDYSRVPLDDAEIEEPSNGASVDPTDDLRPDERPSPVAPTESPATAAEDDGGSSGGDRDWGLALTIAVVTLLAAALLVALVLTPRSLRAGSRRRRLAGGPDAVWEELRATAVDLGVPWPSGRSPRETAVVLVEHFDGDRAPLDRIVDAVERARYARAGSGAGADLHDDAVACIAALESAASASTRRRATWLPGSVWRRDLRSPAREREAVTAAT